MKSLKQNVNLNKKEVRKEMADMEERVKKLTQEEIMNKMGMALAKSVVEKKEEV